MFSYTLKRKASAFKFLRYEERFPKVSISVDGCYFPDVKYFDEELF